MKNNTVKIFFPLAILFALCIYGATAQQGKNNGKGQQKGKPEQIDKQKGNADNGNRNKEKYDDAGMQKGKSGKMNEEKGNGQYKNKDKGNKGDDAFDSNDNNNGQGKGKKSKIGSYKDYDYGWDDNSYKNRKDRRSKDKVSLCHKPQNGKGGVNINVSRNALKAHMAHGDYVGNCNNNDNNIFSDIFNRDRTNYYNTVESNREQLFYSQSVLDYAIQKLANTRTLFATQQQNGLSSAEYSKRQVAINQLDDRVSLLQTAVGLATTLLVNSL